MDAAAAARGSGIREQYEYLLHDRDSIFSAEAYASIQSLGLRVLKSPPRSPKANYICERVLGALRRECLDWGKDYRSILSSCSGRSEPALCEARLRQVLSAHAACDQRAEWLTL